LTTTINTIIICGVPSEQSNTKFWFSVVVNRTKQTEPMQSDRCKEAEFCVPANLNNFSTNLALTYPRLEGKYLHFIRGEQPNLF